MWESREAVEFEAVPLNKGKHICPLVIKLKEFLAIMEISKRHEIAKIYEYAVGLLFLEERG